MGTDQPGVLYSFRRCPYAIRARLALASAGWLPGRDLELREVSLQAKPPELLAASAKGTVPVLIPPGGSEAGPGGPGQEVRGCRGAGLAGAPVLAESLAIMEWALQRRDRQGWRAGWRGTDQAAMAQLIAENDGPFKHHLDRFKYPDRFGPHGTTEPLVHRAAALAILRGWSQRLQRGGWLLGDRPCLADWALLPFVRQFERVDPEGFAAEPQLEALQHWLARLLVGPELTAVLEPPWAERTPWHSPSWLYHLALRPEWQAARREGLYQRSSRGRSLAEVGFIHLSAAHQVEGTHRRFYADLAASELVLLVIDPARLADAALVVRQEPAPGSGELFPHLYGPLPVSAVLRAEPWRVEPGRPAPEPQDPGTPP